MPTDRTLDRENPFSAVITKRTLATLSHAIEAIAEAAGPDATVISLFDRGPYFGPMAARYERMVERGSTVIVAYAGDGPIAPGAHHITLADDHALAGEWATVLITPGCRRSRLRRGPHRLGPRGCRPRVRPTILRDLRLRSPHRSRSRREADPQTRTDHGSERCRASAPSHPKGAERADQRARAQSVGCGERAGRPARPHPTGAHEGLRTPGCRDRTGVARPVDRAPQP